MKISIITTTYNSGSTLRQTLESVLRQTYQDIEYWIIDGGSQDNTLELIRSFEPRFSGKLHYLSEPDKGVYDAMNKGVLLATGDYTIFMNSGDRFYNNDVLAKFSCVEFMDADLIYGPVYTEKKDGYYLWEADAVFLKTDNKRKLVFGAQGICHQGLFSKTILLKKLKFNLKYSICADTDLTYRIFINGNHLVKRLDFIISIYNDSMDGISHNKPIEAIRQYKQIYSYNNNVMFHLLLFIRRSKIVISTIIRKILH